MNEKQINLAKLAAPFDLSDIEWRVSRAGMGAKGVFCMVLAYVTNRAIQKRLDEVCGPDNWRNEEPKIVDVNGKSAFACGLSIRINDEWLTKWDVAEPTNVEPAKGGWSGAMKRAGAQWGIGRYLYLLDETFAEVSEAAQRSREWHYAKLPEKNGGSVYYWKTPDLPGWAMPKEEEHEISQAELDSLKQVWRGKFAPDSKVPKDLREGFTRFVTSVCGEFPSADFTCWTRDAFDRCAIRIQETTDVAGPSADVPFEE